MKILLGTVLGTLVGCSLAHGQQGTSSDGPSRERRAVEGTESSSVVDVVEARALLKAFLKSRKSGDLAANPDLVMQRAKKVGERFRKAYPYESLRNRLEYETKSRPELYEPTLSPETAQRLDRSDTRFALRSAPGRFGNFRAKSLEKLHSQQVAQFIAREGFGRTRMPAPPSPSYWELPPAPTIPFAAARITAGQEGAHAQSLPTQVTRYDMLRLHAGDPKMTNEQIENSYYRHVSYDDRMKAMFQSYSAWKTTHNPLNLPSRNLIFDSHDAAVLNFAGSGRNGHARDIDQVAGFGSHAMTKMPRFEPGPIELRYWPKTGKENPVQWLVTQLQLVSLLKHDVPGVYVSNNLPKMEELERADLRPLNEFEAANLERLLDGEHLAMDARANRIRMLGALRASKQCLQCHQVKRGELLGAFSYELVRAELNEPSKERNLITD